METPKALPNGGLLLNIISLSKERITTGSRAALSLPLLREIITVAASKLPFDEDFYLSTYEDVRAAYDSGDIPDLRVHYTEEGYFEGRLGADPGVDEKFYQEANPDVATAISNGDVASGTEHYVRAGAFEGRFANSHDEQIVNRWLQLAGRK